MILLLLCIFKENKHKEDNMTNVIKFQSPFERTKDYNKGHPEIALLKAIILQAIIDATNISTNNSARKDEVNAKAWIYSGSEEFNNICSLVNYEPDYVKRIASDVAKLHKTNSTMAKYHSKSQTSRGRKREDCNNKSSLNYQSGLEDLRVKNK